MKEHDNLEVYERMVIVFIEVPIDNEISRGEGIDLYILNLPFQNMRQDVSVEVRGYVTLGDDGMDTDINNKIFEKSVVLVN